LLACHDRAIVRNQLGLKRRLAGAGLASELTVLPESMREAVLAAYTE
jgi:hypothetical protein